MLQKIALCVLFGVLLGYTVCYCQDVPDASSTDKLTNFPSKFFTRLQQKTAGLDQQLTKQTEKYLQKMMKREDRLRKKLYKIDSAAAKNLFANSEGQYIALQQKLQNDTGSRVRGFSGEYQPHMDSLSGALSFLQKNPQVLSSPSSTPINLSPQFQNTASQLQTLQAKLQDADQIKAYIQQRKQVIGEYISQHASLSGLLGKQYQGMNQDAYYYSQQVRQYKEMLNNPDQLEQKALSLLEQLPAFQSYMKSNSQLAGLFNLPGNYGASEGLTGLQTKDQIGQLIQSQVSAGGAGGTAALQSSMQSAQSQLDGFKEKLSQLGQGSGDIDMPNFKPNNQKTKTLWQRLEYGANFQTTRNNYLFPIVADFGLSAGYRLSDRSTVGGGASLKVGLGSGISHIAFTGNGVGLRSYVDILLKGSFSATGGLEYNYTTPFISYQQIRYFQYWTQSGLIGVTKTTSVKSRVFKKIKLSLLWDFLSYQQVPKTQPILFRVGYGF